VAGLRLDLARLTATGDVRALNAHISGPLVLEGVAINHPGGIALSLNTARVDGGRFLRRLTATGEVRVLGPHIASSLDLLEDILTNPNGDALRPTRAVVDGGVFLDNSTARGCGVAVGAHIAGQLNLRGASVEPPIQPSACPAGLVRLAGSVGPSAIDPPARPGTPSPRQRRAEQRRH